MDGLNPRTAADDEAVAVAWDRTLAFFCEHLFPPAPCELG
jgi:hypothetical protein